MLSFSKYFGVKFWHRKEKRYWERKKEGKDDMFTQMQILWVKRKIEREKKKLFAFEFKQFRFLFREKFYGYACIEQRECEFNA